MRSPLQQRGVLILRPQGLGDELAEVIREAGGNAMLFPTIEILPAPRPARLAMLIARLHTFDCAIFISPTAVREGLREVCQRRHWPEGVRVAAVGQGTAQVLRDAGHDQVIAPPPPGDSEALAALPEFQDIAGQNLVIFRGDGGREYLARALAAREIVCPASPEGGDRRQCITCQACDGAGANPSRASIAIIVHGPAARAFERVRAIA